jgi:hypothetical protein
MPLPRRLTWVVILVHRATRVGGKGCFLKFCQLKSSAVFRFSNLGGFAPTRLFVLIVIQATIAYTGG